jgi:hypothetical protein
MPLLKLDKSALDFGKVSYVTIQLPGSRVQRLIYDLRYSTAVSQSLSIQNAGTVIRSLKVFALPFSDTSLGSRRIPFLPSRCRLLDSYVIAFVTPGHMNTFDYPNLDPRWLKIEPMAVGVERPVPLHRLIF